jgi:hypothetical protein
MRKILRKIRRPRDEPTQAPVSASSSVNEPNQPSIPTLQSPSTQQSLPMAQPSPTSASSSGSNIGTISKNIFKTTLLLLKGALTGLPIPAAGVVDVVIQMIEIAEVRIARPKQNRIVNSHHVRQKTKANRETLQNLNERFKKVMDAIVTPLKGVGEEQVSIMLRESLGRLAEYVSYYRLRLHRLINFKGITEALQ